MMGDKARYEALLKECDLLLETMKDAWWDAEQNADKISELIAKTIGIKNKVINACKETDADIFYEGGFMSKATATRLRASMMKWLVAITMLRQAADGRNSSTLNKIDSDIATIRQVILMIGEWEEGEGSIKLDQVYKAFPHDKIEQVIEK